jgi:hypothetical protein
MPRFNVGIHGDDLVEACEALSEADIAYGETGWSGSDGSYELLVAHIDAESADEALARVREHLPSERQYTVGPTASPPLPEKFARRSSPPRDLGREYQALALRRALVAEPQTGDGLRVEAVHLYDDAVRILYVLPSEIDRDHERGGCNPRLVVLADDLGTEYHARGGGSGGHRSPDGVEVIHGHTWFTPAVPDAAQRLTVATLVGDVIFDLAG